jgi:flagellar hook-associated protein 3 FlgL
MSASLGIMYNNVNYALSINSEALLRLQEQAATGQRVNRPSDAPSDAYRILDLDSQSRTLSNYSQNISDVTDLLNVASTAIENVQTNIADARTKVTQIITGTFTDEGSQRNIMGQAINDILEQVLFLANSQHLGQYIFGGNNTTSAPYEAQRANGMITGVSYQGSDTARTVEVAPGVTAPATLTGSETFGSNTSGTPVFYGTTGAKAGTGTSSVQGDVWLTVTNDGSNYKLSIDDGLTYTTVPAGGSENQAVTDSRTGKVLYVDTRNITTTGIEPVRVPGTYDVFGTLISVRDLLLNSKNLSTSQLQELREKMADSLDEVDKTLAQQMTAVGGKISSLTNLKDTLDTLSGNATEQSDTLRQADISQVAIDLSRRQTLYQMSLQVAGKMLSLSLLDFIQ